MKPIETVALLCHQWHWSPSDIASLLKVTTKYTQMTINRARKKMEDGEELMNLPLDFVKSVAGRGLGPVDMVVLWVITQTCQHTKAGVCAKRSDVLAKQANCGRSALRSVLQNLEKKQFIKLLQWDELNDVQKSSLPRSSRTIKMASGRPSKWPPRYITLKSNTQITQLAGSRDGTACAAILSHIRSNRATKGRKTSLKLSTIKAWYLTLNRVKRCVTKNMIKSFGTKGYSSFRHFTEDVDKLYEVHLFGFHDKPVAPMLANACREFHTGRTVNQTQFAVATVRSMELFRATLSIALPLLIERKRFWLEDDRQYTEAERHSRARNCARAVACIQHVFGEIGSLDGREWSPQRDLRYWLNHLREASAFHKWNGNWNYLVFRPGSDMGMTNALFADWFYTNTEGLNSFGVEAFYKALGNVITPQTKPELHMRYEELEGAL